MIIYCICNNLTGKKYVGLTRQSLETRWKNHVKLAFSDKNKQAIHYAILKYGPEAFSIRQIDTAKNTEDLSKKESQWINSLNTISPNGYNLTTGGESGFKFTIESIEKNRQTHLGKKHSVESIEKMKQANKAELNGFFGKKHKNETKQIMSIKKQNTRHTSDQKQRRSQALKEMAQKELLDLKLKKMKQAWVDKHSVEYSFISPNKEIVNGKNLTDFCKINGLSQPHMHSVLKGYRKSHKGWTKNPNLIVGSKEN
jgi:group I intron endonuclease